MGVFARYLGYVPPNEARLKLTASKVKSAGPSAKAYKLADGAGMYLLVHPSGAKYWRLKYRIAGKEKLLALGVYPEVSLAEARLRRENARSLVRDGRDPGVAKQLQKNFLQNQDPETFEAVAREWYETKIADKSESYRVRTLRILEKDLFPKLGALPISGITSQQLLETLRVVEERTVDIAHRAKQSAGQVFRYAVATGRAERDIATDLTGALRSRTVKHSATILDPSEIGQLLRSIDAYSGSMVVKAALRLSPLLFVRPGELRTMEWDEIDWQKSRWEIPASKMKMREPHVVPLANQSAEILKALRPLTGQGAFVFPSARKGGRPLSDNGVRTALRSLGYTNEQITPHGFRAMARTLLDEELGFRIDYIEHQLAHTVKDPLGRAYNRTKHLDERIKMMQGWADYLDQLRSRA
jgi:integrase